jgi:hypothetical protein
MVLPTDVLLELQSKQNELDEMEQFAKDLGVALIFTDDENNEFLRMNTE